MKKTFLALVVLIAMVCSTMVLAEDAPLFDAITYPFDIFFDGKKMNLNSPVVLINGQTYVPLREVAENMDLDVEWQGNRERILLTEKSFDKKAVFEEIFEFSLPETAEILNYEYVIDPATEEQYMTAKILFKESDLSHIRTGLNKTTTERSRQSLREVRNPLSYYSNVYTWWDLSTLDNCKYVYNGFKSGVNIKTIEIWAFICEAEDDNTYYLYLSNL